LKRQSKRLDHDPSGAGVCLKRAAKNKRGPEMAAFQYVLRSKSMARGLFKGFRARPGGAEAGNAPNFTVRVRGCSMQTKFAHAPGFGNRLV
jgi:hypothetical protein